MESSINFSSFVTGKNFIGRKKEVAALSRILRDGGNAALYEPSKTGKQSLIQQALVTIKTGPEKIKVVQISLLNIRSTGEFLLELAQSVIGAYSSSPDECREKVETLLDGTAFTFNVQAYKRKGCLLKLEREIVDNDIDAVLSLPFRMFEGKQIRLILIINEFQNIMLTDDGDKLCRRMASIMKGLPGDKKASASIVFCGSQVNAMKEIFEHKKYFFRLGESIRLSRIDETEVVDSANKYFLSNGKVVERDQLVTACKIFRSNIWYMNHFCALCDNLSKGYITDINVRQAIDNLISIHEPRFIATMNDLTTFQVSLLRAILDGYVKFSSAEVIQRYSLNSSANVRRLKDALCKKEIITFEGPDNPVFLDPLLEYWVRKYFFKMV